MKAHQFSSGSCLIVCALIAVQMHLALAGFSMTETCKYYSQGYIANPDTCKGWGYCSGGALAAAGECTGDLLFDRSSGTCNFANKTTCASNLASTCSLVADPIYVANPSNCSEACYCNNGTYSCVSCPPSQYFNPTTRECVYTQFYSCPADSICRLVPNNQFVGDPSNCGNYIQCTAGSGQSTECPNSLTYNALANKCSATSVCGAAPPSTSNAGPGIDSNLANSKTACAALPSGVTAGTGGAFFVNDGQTCFGYFSCASVGAEVIGTWYKCPMGTHFSQAAQQCVTPYTVDCDYDRCGNLQSQFVTAPNSGCKKYNYCINQTNQTQYINSCGSVNTGYAFFDEYTQTCVQDVPSYKIC